MGVIKELDITCSEFLPEVCQLCNREEDYIKLKGFMLSLILDVKLLRSEFYFNNTTYKIDV